MRLLTAVTLTLFAVLPVAAGETAPRMRQQPMRQQPPGQGQTAVAEDLTALNRRVRELYDAKKYEEAAKLAQTAVEEAERQFGPDSLEASAELMNLANIYTARRNSEKARKALARVIELRAKRPGPSQQFEQDALEQFTCLDASDLKGKPDLDASKIINRILAEDSVLAQGYKLSPDRSELRVGEYLSKPPPQFPPSAKAMHASGAVVLRIVIDEAGKVAGMKSLDCSSKDFTPAGVSAASRATFSPTTVNDKPVKVRGLIFYRWIMQR